MKPIPRDKRTQDSTDREQAAREHDGAGERDDRPGRARTWRIGATQMAAPSTRRWRRAGRFGS